MKHQFSTSAWQWLISTCVTSAATIVSSFAPVPAFAAQDCASLANLKIENTNLLSATEVPANGDLPAYCRVLGYVRPAINFEIRLPLQGWNGKFYQVGCGGACGTLNSDASGFTNAINYGLRRNYAVSTSDSGHWGSNNTDWRWAMNNPVAVMDFAQRSVPETARVTKVVLKSFYGTEQKKSYFAGCSNGGRMAVMEALRYPKDFDGIISGAPALDATGVMNVFGWTARANTGPDGKPILSPAKVKLLEHAVYATCGEKIGITEAVIADPRACHFKPSALTCTAGGDAADGLTQAEVDAAEKIYGGPVNSRGQRLYPSGQPLGSEPFWPLWVTGTRAALVAQDFYRYVAFQPAAGPPFKATDYDFDKDPPRLAYSASILNAATFNPSNGEIEFGDMNAFRQGGGKLIIYHGWADSDVLPQLTIDFYEALAKKSRGMTATQDFARLFMVPGMDHCGIQTNGPGIADTGIDPLTALERWVEEGKAPNELIATKIAPNSNQTIWRRPVCAYPKVARYKGSGDPTDATSFTCTEP